ncbi:MAG TPA: response regulator transcription factor [Verrucomicrobiales bacterium]|nr:response regulator transcription factor [Verrucomicrobiales bacterium]
MESDDFTSPVRVLIVDDHPVFRQGMVQVIGQDPVLELCGEANGGQEALALVERSAFDVVVVDVDMPGMDGLELATRLLNREPPLNVVILTMHKNERIFNRAIDIGVSGYILKDEAARSICEGVRCAARGEPYVTPSLTTFFMRRRGKAAAFEKQASGWESLTPMERAIIKHVAQNRSSKEIGAILFISPRTVGTHRTNISKKLALTGKHTLLNFALEHKSEISAMPD